MAKDNLERLGKVLAQSGAGSRRKCEELIREGRVYVGDLQVRDPAFHVDPLCEEIRVDGESVRPEKKVVYLLNKPPGLLCTSRDDMGRPTVLDLFKGHGRRLFTVGRLDKDSTGLLLITNDGDLHQKLSHPSFDHEKEYDVTVARTISDASLRRLEDGVTLSGKITRAAVVKRIAPKRFRIILKEGRNRQIRRMVEKVGNRVVRLKRIRVSNISLGTLARGEWRHLTRNERESLKKSVGGKD